MKAALYARVSCSHKIESMSLYGQLREMRDFAENKGWQVYDEFVDEAFSGNNARRPAFQKLIESAKLQEFSVVVVWKFSRFARKRSDSNFYKDLLQQYGISVVSVNETQDKPTDKLVEGVIELFNEYYSDSTSQDTKMAMRENSLRNFFNGGRAPVGYNVIREGDKSKLVSCPKYAPIVAKIFQLCIAGNGVKEIAKILYNENIPNPQGEAWGRDHIKWILKNTVYTKDLPKPIISQEIFNEAQHSIAKRRPRVVRANSNYLLSGLLFCGNCGSRMFGQAKSPHRSYYCCYKYSRYGKHICTGGMINCRKIENEVVTQTFAKILQRYSVRLQQIIQSEIHNRAPSSQVEQQIGLLEQKLQRYFEAFESGKIAIDCIAQRMETLYSQLQDLQQRSKTTRSQIAPSLEMQLRHNSLDWDEIWQSKEVDEKKRWLGNIIRRVEYSKQQTIVEYCFG